MLVSTGFEWDETKRAEVLEKRGIDFQTAILMFEGPVLEVPSDRNEPRWLVFGVVGDGVFALVYTVRNGVRRVVTARRAKRSERKKYHDYVTRGGDPPTG